ncbi:MAG TPA: tyrosine--tRNA ligase [Candidatus Avimonoglobus intestinipullorum]|uniref:Tyrosine--tRNA ligase n=1 Tax=Candidatus Avimonoglobus intestinipullorum TaxID=2840699 RepID=A0A9D1S6Y0_9FIRM|nr:tyrosine--tRNA ligase [Candidatus Avimonoglobus intestinipullorum]
MSKNVYDTLKERGLIAQTTHEDEIRELLGKERVTFYIGFDPTADSLHVGHFLQMVVMKHMQDAGHRPIALVGGGTGMVGDPSGRTDMRSMMNQETIQHNCDCFKKQLGMLIDFSDDKAIMVNNADWLLDLNYIAFLREIGTCFSVNKMLTAECFKKRIEKGLSFLEFNYMLMQAYDFLMLNRKYGCKIELGGDDQWSNILAGIDLCRRKDQTQTYGMTFTLLTTSEGIKMGKTAKGALWLDPEKCKPYDFYQYWVNVQDADVINCLKLITFVPMDEIREMEKWEGKELNAAKKRLAYEVTKLVHGEEEAQKAQKAAEELFVGGGVSENMPTTELAAGEAIGAGILDVLLKTGLIPSKAEGRRLVQQNGLSVNEKKVNDPNMTVTAELFAGDGMIIKKGKKVFHRVVIK